MSLSDNYPDIRPVWMNDYANAGVIDPRCSFNRSDSTPSNVHYWSDEDHLSSENFLLQSQSFDTTWGTGPGHLAGTPSGGQSAPDGTSTAFIATATTSASSLTPYVNQPIALSASTTYTMVGHLKAGTASHGFIAFRGSNGNSAYAMVNFSGGTVSHGSYGDFTSPSSSVTALGSSWFRVTLTATTGTSLSSQVVVIGISDGTAPSSAGYASYVPSGETIYLWGAQLSSTQTKVYDSPTTTQIHREYAATLKSVAYSGQPRFEYEPTGDREAKGLLIEGSSTTKTTYSEQMFTDYVKNRSTITTNSAIAPSGELTANLWTVDGTASNSHNLGFDFATGGTATHTYSVFAKAGNVNYLIMRWSPANGAFNDGYVSFNLANGTIGTTTGTVSSSSIQDCSNGWYRCSITTTALASTTGRVVLYIAQADNTLSFDGNSYDHLLVWGAQIEEANFPSSYIKSNSGSTSTRTADSLSVATADIGYTGGPFSIVSETEGGQGNYPTSFNLNDGTSSNQLSVYRGSANATTATNRVVYVKSDGNVQVESSMPSSSAAGKLAVSLDTNDAAATASGNSVTTDTSVTMPSGLSQLVIGATWTGTTKHLNGHIKRVALYSEALTDTELQSLTS